MSEGEKPPKAPPVKVTDVRIVDIDIPFNSLVALFLKCIPALLAVAVLVGFVVLIFNVARGIISGG